MTLVCMLLRSCGCLYEGVLESVGITGDMDLRGRVLKVSCIREKALEAMREGAEMLLVPSANVDRQTGNPPYFQFVWW